ncbi:MAG: 16S rRNA (guanine(527)-N(7))-methyltransferase RsmG [Ardenticatenales bacterium]
MIDPSPEPPPDLPHVAPPDDALDDALDADVLRSVAATKGIPLTDDQVAMFARLAAELVAYNRKVNLTRITAPADIAVQHIVDSLMGLRQLDDLDPSRPLRVVDVGSGAGFPGLPLAIMRPHWRFTLVEATGKVVAYLEHAIAALGLTNVIALHARVEDAGRGRELRERFDVAVARALAPLPVVLEYTLPLVAVGGRVLAYKGAEADAEVALSVNALSILGGRSRPRIQYFLPGLDRPRHLVVVDKRRPTPRSYPRKAGTPTRSPL